MNRLIEARDSLARAQFFAGAEYAGMYDATDASATAVASMSPFVIVVDTPWTTPGCRAMGRVALTADPSTSLVWQLDRICQSLATESAGAWLQTAVAPSDQRSNRNRAAIALLKSWLKDTDSVAEQAESLAETMRSLNEDRRSQRKVFR